MARILIITAWYYPFIHPRAHRWTHLAEYWAEKGHQVHVLCARRSGYAKTSVLNGVQVHRTGFDSLKECVYFYAGYQSGRGRVGQDVRPPGLGLRLLFWLYKYLWKNLYFPDDAMLWYWPAKKKVRRLLQEHHFDTLISVSLPFTGHLVGMQVKRMHPTIHWVADIGDPFTIQAQPLNNSWLYGRLSRKKESQVLENADLAVVTNTAAAAAYKNKFGHLANALRVIPPLLYPALEEEEKAPAFSIYAQAPESIHLAYFGSFYGPVRTPDALLDLLNKVFKLNPELNGRLQVHLFGEVFPEFYEKLQAQSAIHLYGLRSRQEVRSAMHQMHFLVNIGNTTSYQLPSKVVDYMAVGKPVVHFSFVEDDPFVTFWGDAASLCSIRVQNQTVSEAEVQRFLRFLDSAEQRLSLSVAQQARLETCRIQAVAEAYAKPGSRNPQ